MLSIPHVHATIIETLHHLVIPRHEFARTNRLPLYMPLRTCLLSCLQGKEMLMGSTIFPFRAGRNHASTSITPTAGATPHRRGIVANLDASAPASSLASKIATATAIARAAAAAHPLDDIGGVEGAVISRRTDLMTNTEPSAMAAESSDLPPPEFPGLHKASLVAGPGGLRCITVALAVLQKVCPPVHRRLERTVSERCGGCALEWGAITPRNDGLLG